LIFLNLAADPWSMMNSRAFARIYQGAGHVDEIYEESEPDTNNQRFTRTDPNYNFKHGRAKGAIPNYQKENHHGR
jgi:hypothetical protein